MPSISEILAGLIQSLANMFGGSSTDNVKAALNAATSVPVADLGASAFVDTYRTVGALTILFAAALTVIAVIVFISKHHDDDSFSPVPAFRGVVKTMGLSLMLPAITTAWLLLSQSLIKGFLQIFGGATGSWSKPIATSPSIADAVNNLFANFFNWIFRTLTWLETTIMNNTLTFFLVLALLAYSLTVIRGEMGRFTRWLWSLFIVTALLQTVVVVMLVFAGLVLINLPMPEAGKQWVGTLLVLFTAIAPFFLFHMSNKRLKAATEGRSRVYGDVVTRRRDRIPLRTQLSPAFAKLNAMRSFLFTRPERQAAETPDLMAASERPQLVRNPNPVEVANTPDTVKWRSQASAQPKVLAQPAFARATPNIPGTVRRVDDELPTPIVYAPHDALDHEPLLK